jgi:hypothetical protein
MRASSAKKGGNGVTWIIGGVALLAVLGYTLTRRPERQDAVSEAWVREQIRERGVRRQA